MLCHFGGDPKLHVPTMKFLICASLACIFASCAQVNTFKTAAAEKVGKLSDFSVAKLMPGADRPPVVQVREKDLKEIQTGHDRAVAFEKSRRNRFWIFGGPVDFVEPELPADAGISDGSLLPPIVE